MTTHERAQAASSALRFRSTTARAGVARSGYAVTRSSRTRQTFQNARSGRTRLIAVQSSSGFTAPAPIRAVDEGAIIRLVEERRHEATYTLDQVMREVLEG